MAIVDEFSKNNWKKSLKSTVWAFKVAFKSSPGTLTTWTVLTCLGALAPAFFLNLTASLVNKVNDAIGAGTGGNFLPMIVVISFFFFVGDIYNVIPNLLWAVMYPRYMTATERRFIDRANRTPGYQFDQIPFSSQLYKTCYMGGQLAMFVIRSLAIPASFIGMIAILVTVAKTSLWLLIPGAIFMIWSVANGLSLGIEFEKNNTISDLDFNYRYTFYNYGFTKDLAHEARSLNAGWILKDVWKRYADRIVKLNLDWNANETKRKAIRTVLVMVSQITVYALGLYLFLRGNMAIGSLAILPSLFDQMVQSTDEIEYKILDPLEVMKNINDIRTFFETDYGDETPRLEEKITQPVNVENVFELRHVSFRYAPDKPLVLDDVSLTVKEGEILSLVGLNGAGKTTIMKLLLGFAKPTGGEVLFNGRPIDEVTRYEYSKRVGAVSQQSYTYDFTLRDNVGVASIDKIDDDTAIMRAVKLGGAEKIVEHAPHGLDNYVGKRFSKDGLELSGGEMQRLSLARTQMIEKEIMLLDEPAAALDPIAELEQYERIRKRVLGHTAVLVSHRISFSRLADRIVVLKNGHVVEQGTHDELMTKKGTYKEMFDSQAQWYRGGEGNEADESKQEGNDRHDLVLH